MKNKCLVFTLAAALSGLPLLTLADSETSQTMSSSDSSTVSSQASDKTVQEKEGAIFETLNIINQSEINAADEALKRSSNDNVKKFAETMKTDHTANLDATKKLSDQMNVKPVETDRTKMLETREEDQLKKLEATSDENFDKDYINAMVKGHQAALQLIDKKLLPKASNSDVESFLKDTRETVAHHLELAQEVQKTLK